MEHEIEVKEKGGDFHLLPVGNYQATAYDIWDLGLQRGEYKGKINILHKIVIGFEVSERIASTDEWNGKRFTIPQFYTLSLGKKSNLRKDLESWRGKQFTEEELKGFKLSTILGANCFLNVIHNDNQRAKISAVTALPKGIPAIIAEAKPGVPAWIKKIQDKQLTKEQAVELMDEVHEAESQNGHEEPNDETIPF